MPSYVTIEIESVVFMLLTIFTLRKFKLMSMQSCLQEILVDLIVSYLTTITLPLSLHT